MPFGIALALSVEAATVAYPQYYYETFMHFLFQLPTPTYSSVTAPGGPCYVPVTNLPAGYQNLVASGYNSLGTFETVVVKKLYQAATAWRTAWTPWYAPLGEVTYFGIRWAAQVQNAVLHKVNFSPARGASLLREG